MPLSTLPKQIWEGEAEMLWVEMNKIGIRTY